MGRNLTQPTAADIISAAAAVYPGAVAFRRRMHRWPEPSGQERLTAQRIFAFLTRLGLKPRYCVDKRGVTATIENGAGPLVALRADIDALPITERNAIPYRSRVPGVMHACGHDIHTAALLGAAGALLRLRKFWQGRAALLFQPSEELEPGGALSMIEDGALPQSVAAIFGLHVTPDHYTGQVGLRSGDDFAGIIDFDVTVRGRGGHVAVPADTIDPIACGADMLARLHRLSGGGLRALQPVVLAVGAFHGGNKRNVVPDTASFSGTIRAFSDQRLQAAEKLVHAEILKAARAFGATAEMSSTPSYPSCYNHPALTGRAARALRAVLGRAGVVSRPRPVMYSDDFAYYQKKTPGVYLHLGVRPRGAARMPGLHSPLFLPEERALSTAIIVHITLALDVLKNRGAEGY